jgi:hypothetical protein
VAIDSKLPDRWDKKKRTIALSDHYSNQRGKCGLLGFESVRNMKIQKNRTTIFHSQL